MGACLSKVSDKSTKLGGECVDKVGERKWRWYDVRKKCVKIEVFEITWLYMSFNGFKLSHVDIERNNIMVWETFQQHQFIIISDNHPATDVVMFVGGSVYKLFQVAVLQICFVRMFQRQSRNEDWNLDKVQRGLDLKPDWGRGRTPHLTSLATPT